MDALYHDTPNPTTKKCPKCQTNKPLDAFSVDKHKASGYRSHCKDCEKQERDKKQRSKPPRPIVQLPLRLFKVCRVCHTEKEIGQFEPNALVCKVCRLAHKKEQATNQWQIVDEINTFKNCSKCGKEKPLTAFYKMSSNTTGYNPVCKDCDDERKQQWNHENIEHVRELKRQYRHEVMFDYNKEYYQKNKDILKEYSHKYYEKNKELQKSRRKEWTKNNLLKCRESDDRRRALKKATRTSCVSYKRILERDGYYCYICEDGVEPSQVSFDHVIPLHRGGTHTEDNIKITHKVCNCRKRFRLLEEMTPFQRRGVR